MGDPDLSKLSCSQKTGDLWSLRDCTRPVKEIINGKAFCGSHAAGYKRRTASLDKADAQRRDSDLSKAAVQQVITDLNLSSDVWAATSTIGRNFYPVYDRISITPEELRDRLAKAWDEGRESVGSQLLQPLDEETGRHPDIPNPYRRTI